MKTVLIVEDEKIIRQGIRTMIQRSGVPVEVVIECNNGEMALEILQEQKVDVMFTDIRMPKLNGIELLQKMQDLPDKPITVAISGYADFPYAVEMLRMGVREYILKPVERERIQEILQKLEEEIQARKENRQVSKKLGDRQLKYLMLNEQILDEEMDLLQTEYESRFGIQEFCICAMNSREKQEERDPYIYLHGIEGNDVYLVPRENAELFLKNELQQEYVGVSALHGGVREVKAAYDEAVLARHRAFCTNQSVVSISDKEKRVPQTLLEEGEKLLKTEMKLKRVQLLGTDKTEEVVRVWKSFFFAAKKEQIKPEAFEEGMDNFFSEIRKTYRNALSQDVERLQKLSSYYSFSNLDAYETVFMDWLLEFHQSINNQLESNSSKQKIKQAILYIQENYAKDLNMAVISNEISMNYSLFSYQFKEYTGTNFVNYLKGIRMEAAKKLLVETDLMIMEISQKVGYDNEKHFMKTFKGYYGVSPSEYRKNAQLR